jgi:hypothetical protein
MGAFLPSASEMPCNNIRPTCLCQHLCEKLCERRNYGNSIKVHKSRSVVSGRQSLHSGLSANDRSWSMPGAQSDLFDVTMLTFKRIFNSAGLRRSNTRAHLPRLAMFLSIDAGRPGNGLHAIRRWSPPAGTLRFKVGVQFPLAPDTRKRGRSPISYRRCALRHGDRPESGSDPVFFRSVDNRLALHHIPCVGVALVSRPAESGLSRAANRPIVRAGRVAAPDSWKYSRMLQSHAPRPGWSRQHHGVLKDHLRATASCPTRTPAPLALDVAWHQWSLRPSATGGLPAHAIGR